MRYPEILSISSEPVVTTYTDKDTILYALSVGMGADPSNTHELPFVYENGLCAVPTMSAVLIAGAGKVLAESGINIAMTVHGEERIRVHKPLPPNARIATNGRCLSVVDKGANKGAVVNIECTIADAVTGDLYCTVIMSIFCRGDGGFGGSSESALVPHEIPSRPPDKEVALKTRPDQAFIYRLNGDRNPLHVDPKTAAKAGFERPILHGLCTYGFACRAVLQAYCDFDPAKIKTFDVRFSSPVYPGETIITRMWKDDSVVSFECGVAERAVTVIKNGRCDLAE
ncbi:MAG: 3-alpha,7-alpha,12-alpha-trihydroxy-5-beta-cholest-24-enoyl-CoA hydratase [Rhodospirillaceae bacterium]|nr:MAG: 3-alpha,7-alpha,12-alpha-trihydroxy-5-beta-cholest-24-enoyl-CoA hydratase [Rhodospirillaceae bacterium]